MEETATQETLHLIEITSPSRKQNSRNHQKFRGLVRRKRNQTRFCGNPEGLEHNTSGKKKLNRVKNKKKIRKKKVSQKLSNWNFGKMMNDVV